MKAAEIKKNVRDRYGKIAKNSQLGKSKASSCCCGSSDHYDISEQIGYSESELSKIPEGADLGLGCGNPIALASLKKGETVLDLGSGAGIDCFLAANKVGKKGRVIGVDMTTEMLLKARANAKKGKYTNVEFRKGEIEDLPVDDDSVDVVISNCVINLVPDKEKAFKEAFRVLRPGGRLMVSDIVLLKELPAKIKKSVAAYTACVSGALIKRDYIKAIKSAGFKNVKIIDEASYPLDDLSSSLCNCSLPDEMGISKKTIIDVANSISSVKVFGIKPKR